MTTQSRAMLNLYSITAVVTELNESWTPRAWKTESKKMTELMVPPQTRVTDSKLLCTKRLKPQYCYECLHFKFNQCQVGYTTKADSRSCRQGIAKNAFRRR